MKKIMCLFGLSLLLVACSEREKAAENTGFKIKGMISNPLGEQVIIKVSEEVSDTLLINENGEISYTNSVLESSQIMLVHGDGFIPVYVENGFDLSFVVDAMNFKNSVVFSGIGAGANNFMVDYAKLDGSLREGLRATFSLPTVDFTAAVDQQRKDKMTLLDKNVDKSKLAEFYESSKRDIEFDGAYMKYVYPQYFFQLTRQTPELDSSYYGFIDALDMKNQANAKSRSFINLATSMIHKESIAYELKDTNLVAAYEYTKFNFEGEIRDALLGEFVYGLINADPYADKTESVYQDYKSLVKKNDNFEVVKKAYQTAASLKQGGLAPDFTFENQNGEMVALSSFKGKMVYIDAWATWCGPCIREIPALKAFIEQNKSDDVVFIQVSVDQTKDKQKWLSMVTQNEVDAVQLFTGTNDKGFGKEYMIKSIPRFILIDKEGKIISANAPRPSDVDGLKALMNI
jgi:thiol-disulfide isomerase/thioredoxin